MNTPMYKAYSPRSVLEDFMLGMDFAHDQANLKYPPYNIVSLGENRSAIEMAVAGFTEDELEVTQDNRKLTITGKKDQETKRDDRHFFHRGISQKTFTRSFTLADTVEVEDVKLKDGLLRVYLFAETPEKEKPKKLVINKD